MSKSKRRKLGHLAHDDVQGADEAIATKQVLIESQREPSKVITADMYGKDIVQIQTEDLLKELSTLRRRRLDLARPLLNQINAIIESLPEKPPAAPVAAEQKLWRESKIAVPYPEPRPGTDVNYTVAYKRPVQINVVGSFALNTAFVRRHHVPTIDMCITLPADVLQSKDYLNHRYFHKRAYYLSCIAAGLERNIGTTYSLHYDFLNNSSLQPVIIVIPEGEEPKFRIRIVAAAPTQIFPAKKTLPNQNCLRAMNSQRETGEEDQVPTPIYNTSVRADCNAEEYLKLLHATAKSTESFPQACVLLRVWLCQRGLGSALSDGGFGGFEASVLVALLLRGGASKGQPLLSSGYSSFQLFKAALQFLHKRDLVNDPMLIQAGEELNMSGFPDTCPVLWDGQRNMNILYKMSISSYSLLRQQAHQTVKALQNVTLDSFNSTFMLNAADFTRAYDDFFRIPGNIATSKVPKSMEGLSRGATLGRKVYSLLSKALGERTPLITVHSNDFSGWANLSDSPNQTIATIKVFVLLDPQQYNRVVDRGPSVEHKKKAAEYRNFWGPKAELRRFQDGSILESVIWQREKDIKAVHRQVIAYICKRELGVEVEFLGWDPIRQETLPTFALDSLDRMNSTLRSFEEFGNSLKNLERLPLYVKSCTPCFVRLANTPYAPLNEDRIEAVLQFEGSANWPEQLVAIQRTKIALLLKMAELMQSKHDQCSCRIGFEEDPLQLSNSAFLDVQVLDQSPVIRVRIQCERETELLSNKLKMARSVAERQAVTDAMTLFDRLFLRSPAHFQALRNLALRLPVLIPSIMLFRKWCSCHLLTAHMSSQLTELLTIRVFTSPYPYSAPANAATALLRILDFLSRWDWRFEPLLVEINDSMTSQQVSEASLRFQAWRKMDPKYDRLAVFAASNVDIDGATWTHQGPSKGVMSRIVALAKAASSQTKQTDEQSFDLSSIFATGLADFDFVIHLNSKFLPTRSSSHRETTYRNIQIHENVSNSHFLTATVSSPAEMFVSEIGQRFADVLVLFHDWAERPIIAALWKPNLGLRDWKVGLNWSSHPMKRADADEGDNFVQLNKSGVLNDIARLGADLIVKIDTA